MTWVFEAPTVPDTVMIWAQVVAAYEASYNRDAHRDTNTGRAAYLRHLAALGYTLAPVEQMVIDRVGNEGKVTDTSE